MTYTINGKEYSELDINKRCAELIGIDVEMKNDHGDIYLDMDQDEEYNPCEYASHTWPIIEKCWDELMETVNKHGYEPKDAYGKFWTRWEYLIYKHNCSKLMAACIFFIEVNDNEQ